MERDRSGDGVGGPWDSRFRELVGLPEAGYHENCEQARDSRNQGYAYLIPVRHSGPTPGQISDQTKTLRTISFAASPKG